MTDTFALSELAAIGRLDVIPQGAPCQWDSPDLFDPVLFAWKHGPHPTFGKVGEYAINPTTHLGAAALAYICARLLGASEEEACGASWRTFIDADGGYDGDDGPEGCTEVTLVTMADGRTFGAWILDGHIDNPEAILAVTRRCVQEAADASH